MKTSITSTALAAAAAVVAGVILLPGSATAVPKGANNDSVTVMAGTTVTVKPLANDRIRAKNRAKLTVIKSSPVLTWKKTGKRITVLPGADAAAGAYVIKYRVVTVSAGRSFRDTAKIKVTVKAAGTTAVPTATPTPTPTPTPTQTATADPTITPTTTPAANTLTARIAALPVAPDVRTGYDRATWKHWNTGLYADGCDTRSEVLKAEAVVKVAAGTACPIYSARSGGGSWYSYYDGVSTTDPSTFDMDHLVALAEAHDSGAYAWDAAAKEAYANDQGDHRSLVAVTASSNRGKSDQDPGEWLPLRERCRYIGEWVAVKHRWDLSVDRAEKDALNLQAQNCANVVIEVIER
ncbi:hypothetical protein QWY28_23085 [Nocardioides sp. SOB77]|uniref:HNH endonuclease n=1 Tax=Nocardioides oceani TaxID=3058369 RepID=A0ABT8FN03_9ACTN|nr:DUF1524 domain-containing protein [Nocardioides oceani]MDN4175860.1 hypothetical protein [Nocardioides oceani]